jgi:hypothetical protein
MTSPLGNTAASGDLHATRGPHERRRHHVYVTRQLEYHTRDGICVAVKDRRADAWLCGHLAVSRSLSGLLRLDAHRPQTGDPPSPIGAALLFNDGRRSLATAVIEAVVRPPLEIVRGYP